MVVPLGEDNGNVINTHMTPSKSGDYEQRRSCGGRISAVKTGFGFICCIMYPDDYVPVRGISIHFDNIVQKA